MVSFSINKAFAPTRGRRGGIPFLSLCPPYFTTLCFYHRVRRLASNCSKTRKSVSRLLSRVSQSSLKVTVGVFVNKNNKEAGAFRLQFGTAVWTTAVFGIVEINLRSSSEIMEQHVVTRGRVCMYDVRCYCCSSVRVAHLDCLVFGTLKALCCAMWLVHDRLGGELGNSL